MIRSQATWRRARVTTLALLVGGGTLDAQVGRPVFASSQAGAATAQKGARMPNGVISNIRRLAADAGGAPD